MAAAASSRQPPKTPPMAAPSIQALPPSIVAELGDAGPDGGARDGGSTDGAGGEGLAGDGDGDVAMGPTVSG